jgi:RNA polymerase sigma factor (sigma-70 family)
VDSDTAIGGLNGQFPSTHLSLIEATASGLSCDAMNEVIALYWKPVYRFVRLKFHQNNEDAKDLTQGFFTAAMQRDFFSRFEPEKASFRTYLRMAVERYASNQYSAANAQKRGGAIQFEPAEPQDIAGESPEMEFEREWRRQLFYLALDDLRVHCEECGKRVQFTIFEQYDLADADRPSYAELAAMHGIAETAVTNYLAWARRRLRGFVTERLRRTTADPRELHQEMRRVWK